MIKWRQLCFLIGYFLLHDFCPINLCHMLFVILVQSVLSEEMLLLPLSATLTAGWHRLLSIKRLRFNQKYNDMEKWF